MTVEEVIVEIETIKVIAITILKEAGTTDVEMRIQGQEVGTRGPQIINTTITRAPSTSHPAITGITMRGKEEASTVGAALHIALTLLVVVQVRIGGVIEEGVEAVQRKDAGLLSRSIKKREVTLTRDLEAHQIKESKVCYKVVIIKINMKLISNKKKINLPLKINKKECGISKPKINIITSKRIIIINNSMTSLDINKIKIKDSRYLSPTSPLSLKIIMEFSKCNSLSTTLHNNIKWLHLCINSKLLSPNLFSNNSILPSNPQSVSLKIYLYRHLQTQARVKLQSKM